MSEKEAMELIARSLEAQRRKLSFVRSTLFFGAGALALAVTTGGLRRPADDGAGI